MEFHVAKSFMRLRGARNYDAHEIRRRKRREWRKRLKWWRRRIRWCKRSNMRPSGESDESGGGAKVMKLAAARKEMHETRRRRTPIRS